MFHVKHKTILLVNPWIYDFAAYDLWAKPLGLLIIGGKLRKMGYDVELIDCLFSQENNSHVKKRKSYGDGKFIRQIIDKPNVLSFIKRHYCRYGITEEVFKERLSKSSPLIILVTSGMTYWYPGLFRTIGIIKEIHPKVPIILGGIYATLLPNHAKRYSGVDKVFIGHDLTLLFHYIKNIVGLPKERDNCSYPCFDLYPSLSYLCIITSRGCPFRCSYCASFKLYPNFKQKEIMEVVDEISYWHHKYNVIDFAFYDDALLINPNSHFIPMMKEILKRGLKLRFHTPNGMHAREISYEVASIMYEGGFKTVRLGLETIGKKEKRFDSKVSKDEFSRAINLLHKAGYTPKDIGVYLLAGLPYQDFREVKEAINFVFDRGGYPKIAEYSPIPGTPLWQKAVKSSKFDLVSEPLFHNNTILPCQWKGFSLQDLADLKRYINEKAKEIFRDKNKKDTIISKIS
ncbi:MAG: radical SAM protein [Deltaproteobacteria bacterium]|nr:radical SAM protein [Deltaproteobacteria bacterium]